MDAIEEFFIDHERVYVVIEGWGTYRAKDRVTFEGWLARLPHERMDRYSSVVEGDDPFFVDRMKFASLPDFAQACVVAEWES